SASSAPHKERLHSLQSGDSDLFLGDPDPHLANVARKETPYGLRTLTANRNQVQVLTHQACGRRTPALALHFDYAAGLSPFGVRTAQIPARRLYVIDLQKPPLPE